MIACAAGVADDVCVCPEMQLPATGAVDLELRILGPVRAVRAGRDLALGGPKQRAVLALLLVEAGRAVPAGYLVEALWRGGAPPGAAGTLRSYVSRLRTLLRPDAALVAQGGGYALAVKPDQLDASDLPRAFRTADLWLIHAADCRSRYSLRTCCGVRY